MPPTFRHFCFRSHRLDLSTEEVLYLELVFACTRFLSNHFTTLLQKTPARKLNADDFHYSAVRSVIAELMGTESYRSFLDVDEAFVDAEAYAISDRWIRYLTKDDPAPVFRNMTGEQYCWVLRPKSVSIQNNSFFLPGSPMMIRLPEPKIRLVGTPVCYQLRRQSNMRYYLAVLYERPMKDPFICTDGVIPQLGIKLQNALDGRDPFATDAVLKEPVVDLELVYQLRKKVLTRYLTPKPQELRNTAALTAA